MKEEECRVGLPPPLEAENGQSSSRGLQRRRGPLPSQRRYLFIIE